MLRSLCFALFAATLGAAPIPALNAQASLPPLAVILPDGREVSVPAATIAALPRVSGTAIAHGNTFTFTGTDLREVLRAAGLSPVDSLRSAQLRRVVIFVAADAYRALIAQSDLDPSIGGRSVVLVDTEDGKPLPPDIGPRRIIVEGDARPTRWVHQVVRIVVTNVP